jgi:hypothetical protein
MKLTEGIMQHYSIKGTDIYIEKVQPESGWHQGDPVVYRVSNCEWLGEVRLYQQSRQGEYRNLRAEAVLANGNGAKMINDREAACIALGDYFQARIDWVD